MNFRLDLEKAYFKSLKRYLKRAKFRESKESDRLTVSSYKEECDYCVEFRNLKGVDFFNKINTTKMLLDCDYLPPSLIIKNKKDWRNLSLNKNNFYFIKPKYGAYCKNISVTKGKEIFINNDDSLSNIPFSIQEEIIPKLCNNVRVDYRTYVLYVKENSNINVYYLPHHLKRVSYEKFDSRNADSFFTTKLDSVVFNTSKKLIDCLKDCQKFIIPKFNKTSLSKVEYFLTGYDLIEDREGKFWILEINSDPNFFHNDIVTKTHQNIFKDIVNSITGHMENNKLEFEYFIKLI